MSSTLHTRPEEFETGFLRVPSVVARSSKIDLLRGRVGRTRRRKRFVRTSHGKTSEYGKIRQKSADFGVKFFRALQCSVSWDNFTRGADEIYTVVQQWAGKSPITATICSPDSHSSNNRRNDPMFVYQTPSKSGDLQSVNSGGYLPRRSGSVNIHRYSPPLRRIIVKYLWWQPGGWFKVQ